MDRRLFIAGATTALTQLGTGCSSSATAAAAGGSDTGASGPLWSWTASQLVQQLHTRNISAREVTQSCLDRVRTVNGTVHAVTHILEDEALAAADNADRLIARTAPRDMPALLGVPVTTKINVDLAGHPTTDGVVAFAQATATEDHSSVANLRKAGAVILGRTNTPAFSFRWFTDNDLHGRTLNPWDPTVTPGGSSGGAAAAVATGMGAIAHGNDIAGSVRYPAYCCGVAGIRPTAGLVPSFNPSSAAGLPGISAQLMGVQGLLARSVQDLRLSLPALAADDPRDPAAQPFQRTSPGASARPRIAVLRDMPGRLTEASVADGLRVASEALRRSGFVVEEVMPPRFQEAADLWSPFVLSEIGPGLSAAADRFGDRRIQTALKTWQGITDTLDLARFSEVLGKRHQIRREWSLFFQRFPVLITPVSWRPPFAVDLDQQGPEAFRVIVQAQSPSFVIALLGLPGLSVPTGVFQGMPTGVQVTAPWYAESLCFDIGELIEAQVGMTKPIDPRATRAA